MNSYYKKDAWLIIEEGFHPEINRESESIFSLGNGYMGQRANFEEHYSGDSMQGNYIAGVYYPDKTRVGWWKNGYPEYFAKVLNAPSWIGIDISVNEEVIDLATTKIISFSRILNMKEGYLERSFKVSVSGDKTIEINTRRFLSMAEPDLGIIRYAVKSIDFEGTVGFKGYIDADIRNEDTNYGKKFWKEISREITDESGALTASTLKTDFHVATGMCYELHRDRKTFSVKSDIINRKKYIANVFSVSIKAGEEWSLHKYVSVLSSLNNPKEQLKYDINLRLKEAKAKGYDKLFTDHIKEWRKIWAASDVVIEGDLAAQQAIRFNIFHLNQTYTGKDERLNIGPKGFTGEKYGGSTYWDTEAFCLPFFLKTADQNVGRNLLLYRYKHLEKSIANAAKLGFKNGAALYPMVTMNGEECHNEWEITFEEIHRNGAVAYAIFNYIRHTGDEKYMAEYGLEVLIGISRFWSQRATFSESLQKHVILGVTGPNEYENNVNNNWYTNSLAEWTLTYTLSNIEILEKVNPDKLEEVFRKTGFNSPGETERWRDLVSNMHFSIDNKRKVFLQQDGFLDKELVPANSIPSAERPINQNWSWDRILRSCFLKQADVVQGLYLFEDKFDTETIKRNFDFYEPMTLHESSLSACIHSIVASRIGNIGKAYELYLRTARLDLDDYNNEVSDGLHITSMAGTWLAIVEGFGGMRILDGKIQLNPLIPVNWKSYSFHARFRGALFEVKVTKDYVNVNNISDKPIQLVIYANDYQIKGSGKIVLKSKAS
ncbi:MAG TPA: family 65 glycosyl hydrolase domain-containing protein [Bacteroidales bacterium]|nr:family 65 glycosyl hydrolase domain-containing protein [Bacteroidales bacterium]